MPDALAVFNEDAALLRLSSRVSWSYDINNPDGLEVPVRYRLPEDEIVAMTYPIIIIELQDITFAEDRQFSGDGYYPYAPEGYSNWWDGATSYDPSDSPYRWDVAPTAYNIDYRVSVYSRLVRDHLLPLTARLLQYDMLTARGAYLNVPQDGTFRRITLLGGPKIAYANVDADDNQKRFVTSTFLIRVPTEILNGVTDVSPGMYARATQINIDLTCYQDMNNLNLQTLSEEIGIVSAGANLGFNTQSR